MNFRSARHHQDQNQLIVSVSSVSDRNSAEKLIGKKVSYSCEGKQKKVISGEVASAHGNSGALRAIFEKGLPGQCIGRKVKIE